MMPPLDVLPHEVIEEIAVHACRSPFLGPPAALPGLLVLSRRTHGALAVQFNPGLHARIFHDKFDTLAPARRFAAAGQPLTAANYALELRRRFITLRRIRRVAGANTNAVCSEEDERADFWTIFLMFLESDGKNYDQLVRWANVTSYMRIFIRDQLVPSQRPGFPLESTLRSLGLWVMWFLTEIHAVVAEMRPDVAQIQAMLRPWVLAAFKYDALFAPYNYYHLPAPSPHAVPAVSADHELLLTPQFLADLELRDRTELVTHMARRIRLAPPPASLAAIMALMVRLERNGPIPSRAVPVQPPDPGPFVSTISPHHPGLTIYPRTRFPSFQGPGSTEFDGRPNAHGSAKWDSEWLRIVSCGNPQAAVPPAISQQPKFRPGDLAGVWEGRFVFISFDDFRDMLTGSVHAAQNGQLAQQPQVWRIREHHCIDRRRRIGSCSDPRDYVRAEPLPVGNSLDAYIPANAEFIQHGEVLPPGVPISAISNRRLEIRIPNPSSTNGFDTYSYVTMDGSDEFNDIPGYVPIPTYYMDMCSDAEPSAARPLRQEDGGDDEWIETITDTIITGEGHSSWGRFHLRGRIRHWDGMITVVKDYAGPNTEGRGRWLYKGYVVAGANWVGRWRDTFTAEHLVGYEGVFSVSRRV